jgi:hypothetical protein
MKMMLADSSRIEVEFGKETSDTPVKWLPQFSSKEMLNEMWECGKMPGRRIFIIITPQRPHTCFTLQSPTLGFDFYRRECGIQEFPRYLRKKIRKFVNKCRIIEI